MGFIRRERRSWLTTHSSIISLLLISPANILALNTVYHICLAQETGGH